MTVDPHTAQSVRERLLQLKDDALEATKRSDGDFYDAYLSDDCLAIVSFGIFNKSQVVAQMSSPSPPLRATAIADVQAIPLTADCGLVTYRATYASGDVLVSTLYLQRDGKWQGVLYQQTPIARP